MTASISDVQKISVALSPPDLAVEPGSVTQLTVTVANLQNTPDRLSLEVEGIDVEWYAIPMPIVNLAPGAKADLKIPFKIARTSGNSAGTYPFLVRIQALESGEVALAQASLTVKQFSSLQMELDPKRAIASFFRPLNDFEVTITNQGNREETLDLFATDPEDACAYEYDVDRIALKPGQSVVVPMAARPKSSSIIGGSRIYGFSVSARSVDDSYISASAYGQIEKHPLISPLLGIFFLLLGAIGAGIFFFRPKPPEQIKVRAFTTAVKEALEGNKVQLSWNVTGISTQNGRMVLSHKIGEKGDEVQDTELTTTVGNMLVDPKPPYTTYYLTVTGTGEQKSVRQEAKIMVKAAPAPNKPQILSFAPSQDRIHLGDSVTLSWKTKDAKELILDPGNVVLSSLEESRTFTPTQKTTYTLRALNARKDKDFIAKKEITVDVVPVNVCIAEIVYFGLKPQTVYINEKATLSWLAKRANNVLIECSDPTLSPGDSPSKHNTGITFTNTNTVTFTITATDSANKTVSKSFTVTPKVRPIRRVQPEPETSDPPPPSDVTEQPSTPRVLDDGKSG